MSSAFPPGLDLATTPLGPPPPGVTPDFNAQDSAPSIRILCIVLLVLITLFTSARVYTRAAVLKSFGWDDTFLVLAWASVVVHMTFILLGGFPISLSASDVGGGNGKGLGCGR
jgi:hypothetical protein